jgi:uncharacterized RDD family membrane protein YckC
MSTSPEPQTQPPQTPPPPQPPSAPADAPRLASFGARLLAHLIDLLFLLMVFFLLGTVWGALWGGLTDEGFEINGLSAVVPMGLTLLAFLAYLVLFESALAATPGKFIVGLRVREVSGRRCTFGQAARRNLLRLADLPTLYLVALFTKS